jgi:hypothetical protein
VFKSTITTEKEIFKTPEKPKPTFNTSHEDIIREEIKMRKAEEDEKRKKEEARERRFEEISQQLKSKYESKLTIKYLNRICLVSRISKYHNVIFRKLKHLNKARIFKAFKLGTFYQKLNREYLEQLLSITHNELTTYNNFISDLNYNRVTFTKENFFTYIDLRNCLIKKPIDNGLNHVKIVLFTQRTDFHSTSIFQNLFQYQIEGLEINDSQESLEVIDKGFTFKLDAGDIKTIIIILKFIFIDKIENIAEYIHDNQTSLDKFTYGLIYFDFSRITRTHFNNLLMLLDYSCAYKTLLLIDNMTYNTYDTIRDESILILCKRYKVKMGYQFCSKLNFSDYFSNIIEYFNNKQIFELFDNEIEVQTYKIFSNMSIVQYYREMELELETFLYDKELFVNLSSVTSYQWVKWFTNVSFIIISV